MSKPKITLIAAMAMNKAIGSQNALPWNIPEDLAYFKQVTLHKPIIMGRKTFESIGKVLPHRPNIVITRNQAWSHPEVDVYASIQQAIMAYSHLAELCIIGGGEIFQQTIDIADTLYITLVDMVIQDADTFFPDINLQQWQLIQQTQIITKKHILCSFNKYIRSN